MKKNLLSVLILAVLIVNLVLTSIMMFSVMGAMKTTTKFVGKIATVLDIELATDVDDTVISIEDTSTYTTSDYLTILLKNDNSIPGTTSEEGKEVKDRYTMLKITLYMNNKHADFEKFGTEEALVAREEMIRSEIVSVIGGYTRDEFKNDPEGVYAEILTRLQKMYNSKFIYRVASGDVKFS